MQVERRVKYKKTYTMVKKSIFTLLFLAVMGWASAQSLQFELNGHVFAEGETIECTNDEYGIGEYIQHMQLRNCTSDDLNVMIEKEVVEDLEGTSNLFCWGQCFSENVFISPNPVVVAANSVTDESALAFHVTYNANIFGKVHMRYYAYDEDHYDQRISINVIFNKSDVGVHETAAVRFGQAYPNPASSVVNFDYNLNAGDKASVAVYNLLGQEVLKQPVNSLQGRVTISVANLNNGIYFCNLFVNGCAVKTEKFVVKK